MIKKLLFSERRACRLVGISRSSYRYEAVAPTDGPIRNRLKELAGKKEYLRYGTPRLTRLLRDEGFPVNHKRVERIYREEGLAYRRKKTKKKPWGETHPLCELNRPNEEWAMDFLSDRLADGRSYRILNIIDQHTRESLAMEIDTSISGERVCRVLDRAIEEWGLPERIRMDNGPEFTGHALKSWFSKANITPVFIQPGKPNQNGYIESFHGKFRDEWLSLYSFRSLREAREACAEWRRHYNETRGHSSLGGLPPAVFARRHARVPSPTAPGPRHEPVLVGSEL